MINHNAMHTIVYVITTVATTFKAMKMAASDSQCKPGLVEYTSK